MVELLLASPTSRKPAASAAPITASALRRDAPRPQQPTTPKPRSAPPPVAPPPPPVQEVAPPAPELDDEALLSELDDEERLVKPDTLPEVVQTSMVAPATVSSEPSPVAQRISALSRHASRPTQLSYEPSTWTYRAASPRTQTTPRQIDLTALTSPDELETAQRILARLDNQTLSLNWIYCDTPRHRLLTPTLRKLFSARHSYSGRLTYFDDAGGQYTVGLVSEPIVHDGRAWLCLLYGRADDIFQPTQLHLIDAALLCE